MNIILKIIDILIHTDKYLSQVVTNYGMWAYLLLFVIIFVETGIVIFPFLPGDSLIFAAGAISAAAKSTNFNIFVLWILLLFAAISGDTVNYWIGHRMGPAAFKTNNRFLKKKYMDKAQEFYEKHGGKAIFLARFVPIVRTFAPFIAGIGKMDYKKFIFYNAAGGFTWVSLFLWVGYFFGNTTFAQHNFEIIVIAIVLISVLPVIFEVLKERIASRKA